jgi:hypothetical protein
MAHEPISPQLSDERKQKICLYLSVGCDREAAAKLCDCTHWDIHCAMQRDAAFADEVRRAEGASELVHVRNVQNASQDAKNWRASVWWLERRSPERFGKRGAGTVTTRQLKAFIAQLATIVTQEISDANDRQRLLDRFDRMIKTLDQLIFDETRTSDRDEVDSLTEDRSEFDDDLE